MTKSGEKLPKINRFSPRRLASGIVLCIAVALAGTAAAWAEGAVFGQAPVDSLVCAILVGAVLRIFWDPAEHFAPGMRFAAKDLLEVGVALMGAALSLRMILSVNHFMLIGVALVVVLSVVAGYAVSRAVGLQPRLAVLVACGNSICGNSAIAAISPVIGAEASETIAAIAVTALFGVFAVLLMPLLPHLLGLSQRQYGVLAGLTIYSVPQVVAATVPVGALSAQMGTFTKLLRILMLAPVAFGISLVFGRKDGEKGRAAPKVAVPWFIFAFFALMLARAAGVIPEAAVPSMTQVANVLTLVAMAALGLGVDLRILGRAGPRVSLATVASLAILGGASALLLHFAPV